MYLAGSDTTSSTVIYCIACLLNHPDILKRAQEEIDSVVPFGDLPTFDDEDKLPFITALCKETMRWKELAPLSLPHVLSEDDVYKGYRLPKGSIVLGNAWTVLHDERIYPDPFSFKPDRFLKNGKINKEVRDPAMAIFGFGRRICPGRFIAFPAVWMTVASIIAAFDIARSPDADGNVIDIDLADDDCEGFLRFPKPFTCSMSPRSLKHEEAILAVSGVEY